MADDVPDQRGDVEVSCTDDAVVLKLPAEAVTLTPDEARELAANLVEAAAHLLGVDPEENDLIRLPMQYIHAAVERSEPFEDDEQPEEATIEEEASLTGVKFAEVHCWIRDQTRRNAFHVAAGWMIEHGWTMIELLDHDTVSREDFIDTEYLTYYDQALTDSEVFLYEIEDSGGEESGGPADAS